MIGPRRLQLRRARMTERERSAAIMLERAARRRGNPLPVQRRRRQHAPWERFRRAWAIQRHQEGHNALRAFAEALASTF